MLGIFNQALAKSDLSIYYNNMELQGKRALITGASGRLASEIVYFLAQKGCGCICHYYKNEKAVNQLAQRIKDINGLVWTVQADLTEPDQLNRLFNVPNAGEIDFLINCAGIFEKQAIEDIDWQQINRIMAINFSATLMLCKTFAERQTNSIPLGGICGKIVNFADIAGIRPWANYSLYCASKAAVISITKSLAKELAPAITVNAVAPGVCTYPDDFGDGEKIKQINMIPLKRKAQPEEIASAVQFLLENDYMTGQVISIDGGRGI